MHERKARRQEQSNNSVELDRVGAGRSLGWVGCYRELRFDARARGSYWRLWSREVGKMMY